MDSIRDRICSYKHGDRELRFRFDRGAVLVEEVVVTGTPVYNGQVEDFIATPLFRRRMDPLLITVLTCQAMRQSGMTP